MRGRIVWWAALGLGCGDDPTPESLCGEISKFAEECGTESFSTYTPEDVTECEDQLAGCDPDELDQVQEFVDCTREECEGLSCFGELAGIGCLGFTGSYTY